MPDTDDDGLGDACELALARAFAPALVVDTRDCLWRADAGGGRLAGGWLFAAQPIGGGVRIAYLPAYLRDCGWSGVACVLRAGRCGAHAGDSELVLVDLASTADGRWEATGIFLSAHCFGHSDGRCRWYRGDALDRFAWVEGRAPVVWVARGKHGGYPTREACDTGHWSLDSCDDNAATFRFPVDAARNVGSRVRPAFGTGGCVTSARLAPMEALPDAAECVWDARRPFRGWQGGDGPGPTSYASYLARFAAF